LQVDGVEKPNTVKVYDVFEVPDHYHVQPVHRGQGNGLSIGQAAFAQGIARDVSTGQGLGFGV